MFSDLNSDFRQWLQEQLGEKRVQKVEVSNRLVGSAATLVQSSYGMSPTMARYMKAQAVAFGEQDSTMTGSQQVCTKSMHVDFVDSTHVLLFWTRPTPVCCFVEMVILLGGEIEG